MTDYRAELQTLVTAYDEHGGRWPQHHEDALFNAVKRARTALAEPADAPAVPEGRGPAAVAEQPRPAPPAEIGYLLFELRAQSELQRVQGYGTGADALTRAAALLEQLAAAAPAVVPVSERLPEPSIKVLAYYLNSLGKGRTVCAIWVPAKTRSDSDCEDDFTEYDEETDKFYWTEGWYEQIENWEDLGWVRIYEGEVVYWQPLPKWPAHALPLPAPQGGEVGA